MRAFSNFEQRVIKRMIELDEKSGSLNVLGNIYSSFANELRLPDYCYINVESKTDVTIKVKKALLNNGKIDLHTFDDEVSKTLLTTVKLFEYLEIEGIAYFIGDLDNKSLGQIYSDEKYESCDFLEAESKALIYKYTRKKIYLGETLKLLAKNGFKSEERIRHEQTQEATKKQLKHTQLALALTFLGLLASILFPMFSTTDINIKNKVVETSLSNENMKVFRQNSNIIKEQLKLISVVNKEINTSIKNKQYKEFQQISLQLNELNLQVNNLNNLLFNYKTHNKGLHWTPKSYAPSRYAPSRSTFGSQ